MQSTVLSAKESHSDLARRIIDLARYRNLEEGHHLAEQWLANEFGVSRSLVRSALQLLARHDIVRSTRGRGFSLAFSASAPDAHLVEIPPTREEELYASITRDCFSRRLSEQVTATQLMRNYDANRTTINRVLSRLNNEGLIDRGPGSRWTFRPALNSPDTYQECYRFRLLIEPSAILESSFKIDEPMFQQIRRAHQHLIDGAVYNLDLGRLFEIDARFHECVGACSGNRFLAEVIRQQNLVRRLSEYAFYDDRDRLYESCLEHLKILDAIENGDRKYAAQLMHEHIAVSRDVLPPFANGSVATPSGS